MTRYRLENLDCPNCAAKLEKAVASLEAVSSVSVNFASMTMAVEARDLEAVERAVKKTTPEVSLVPLGPTPAQPAETGRGRRLEFATLAAAALLTAAGFAAPLVFPARANPAIADALFLLGFLAAGWRVLFDAVRSLLKGHPFDEKFLMAIASAGAIALGAFSEAAGTMILFGLGTALEGIAVRKSRGSIRALLAVRPDYANLANGDSTTRVSPLEVNPGDLVLVKPGERIPLDGVVESGTSGIDTSALTGESLPRMAGVGDTVLAGTVSLTGLITVRVTRPFAESSVSRIMDMVENATARKSAPELFFAGFARIYTPAVVALSILVAVIPPLAFGAPFSVWLYRALVVLMVSCPCALVISIPLAYFAGIGAASARGILIKGSCFLDVLASLGTVVFDKTGTLTKGNFRVVKVVPAEGVERDFLVSVAAAAEAPSTHPLAASIREAAIVRDGTRGASAVFDPNAAVEEFENIAGAGIRARIGGREILVGNDGLLAGHGIAAGDPPVSGLTAVSVALDGRFLGRILVGDELKKDARDAVEGLQREGILSTVILSGDGEEATASVARLLGIERWRSGLLPEGKVEAFEEETAGIASRPDRRGLRTGGRRGRYSAFVGDGINDAPVLARADVGISMGNLGSDAAVETADVVIMKDSPAKVAEAVGIARRTRTILIQNVAFALSVKALFIGLGLFGLAGIWEAVFGDTGVALIAVLNSLRVLKRA
jgi:Zn2+/Cd2+-exporting ATPase